MSNAIFPSIRGLAFTVVKSQENSVLIKQSSSWLTSRWAQNTNPRWHWRFEYSVVFDDLFNSTRANAYSDLKTLMGFCQSVNGQFESFLYFDPDDNSVGPGVITASWQPFTIYMLGSIIISGGHAYQVVLAPGGAKSGQTLPSFSTTGGTTTDGGLTWIDLGAATNSGTNWPNPQAQLQVVTDGTNYYSPVQRNLGGQAWEDITDLKGAITVYQNGVANNNFSMTTGTLNIGSFTSSGLYLNWGTTKPTSPVTATFSYYFRVRFEESTNEFEKWANKLWSVGGEQGVQGKGYLKLVSSTPNTSGTILAPPAPPFAFPPGATNQLVLYPQKAGKTPPSSTAIPYVAGAWAGPNASGYVGTWLQGLGSSGPTIWFSTFSLPSWLPAGAVIQVSWWAPFTHTGPGGAGCQGNVSVAGIGGQGILGGFGLGTFYSIPGPFGSNFLTGNLATRAGGWAGGPISTFPYQSVKFQFWTSILNFTTSTDLMHPFPQLIVYY